jgi:hypothetical protein
MTARIPCDLAKRVKYFMIDRDVPGEDVGMAPLEADLAKHKAERSPVSTVWLDKLNELDKLDELDELSGTPLLEVRSRKYGGFVVGIDADDTKKVAEHQWVCAQEPGPPLLHYDREKTRWQPCHAQTAPATECPSRWFASGSGEARVSRFAEGGIALSQQCGEKPD